MKGLLLKDFYFTRIASLFAIAISVLFSFVSYVDDTNSYFFVFYPIIFAGIIVISTFTYEEKFKLSLFTESLPCSRAKVVNGKYILTLMYVGFSSLITVSVQTIKLLQGKAAISTDILSVIAIIILIAIIPQAFSIPLLIRFNATKAQYIVYFLIGAVMGFTGFFNGYTDAISDSQGMIIPPSVSLILIFIAAVIFAISWLISIRIYNKRDLA